MVILELKDNEWYRGNGGTDSQLLRLDGKRCCLGIEAKASGVPDRILGEELFPSSLNEHDPSFSCTENVSVCEYIQRWKNDEVEIAEINDNPDIFDDERIRQLQPFFQERGIELEFKKTSE